LHDSGGIPALVQYFILIVIGSVAGHLLGLFQPVRGTSHLQSLRDLPVLTSAERDFLARHQRIVQLSRTPEPTRVPGLVRTELEHRPILSMRVTFYERWPTRRLFPARSKANTKRVWPNDLNTGKDIVICPVDYGELHLTRRAFVFASARRYREFPFDELTHLSSTNRSLAVATRRGRAMSYFEGVHTATVQTDTFRDDAKPRPKLQAPLNFTGLDIQELVQLLKSASIMETV
jgi:hypothetical protein